MARPRRTVRDDEGREVFGLSHTFDKTARKQRYYITGTKPLKWLGYDKNEAIRRFFVIKARETREKIVIGPEADGLEALQEAKRRMTRAGGNDHGFINTLERQALSVLPYTSVVDAASFYKGMREALIRDPKECARRTGVQELAYLHRLKRPTPSMKVAEPLALYLRRPKRIDKEGKEESHAGVAAIHRRLPRHGGYYG